MALQSINPTTEEVLLSLEEFTAKETDGALDEAAEAFQEWRWVSLPDRAAFLAEAASSLREQRPRLAALITTEMGKPIVQAEAEIDKCAWVCDFYAEHGEQFLTPRPVQTDAAQSYVAFEPLGVILAVMPWNFPFWQVFRFAAPTLMAGNAVVVKHSSNVPQCALAIEEVFREAGFPSGVFRSILIPGYAVEPLIDDDRIAAVTLTGSDATGVKVAMASGGALKKTVMELGGSDPFIVLSDADLDTAARAGARSRARNAGQSCNAAKRFIVVEDVADEFEERFIQAMASLKVGDPMDRDVEVGPLARSDLREHLEEQVRESLRMGAFTALGGARPQRPGYFYLPTVLTGVTPEMPVFHQETFGPVAAVVRARDTQEAVVLANRSPYGLGASLWTRDLDRARAIARQLQVGNVVVNDMVSSDPRLPFGGIKRSGYGRELSEFGIHEFVNIQSVSLNAAGEYRYVPPVE